MFLIMSEQALENVSTCIDEQGSDILKIRKITTSFLLTTYKMLEDEQNQKAIHWSESGKSFIIVDMELFKSILPKYFKTKNYSSFVRQLNLYDFHKVRNNKGFTEFAHDQFHRHMLQNLPFITRKVNHDTDGLKNRYRPQKNNNFEYYRMQETIRKLENSLSQAKNDRDAAIKENVDLQKKYEQERNQNEDRTQKLLFIVWLATENPEFELFKQIRTLFMRFGLKREQLPLNQMSASTIPSFLNEIKISTLENSSLFIQKLLRLVIDFHNSRTKNAANKIDPFMVEKSFENGQNPMFRCRSNSPPFWKTSCAQSDFYSQELSPLRRFPSVLERSHQEMCIEQPEADSVFCFDINSGETRPKSSERSFRLDSIEIDSFSPMGELSPKSAKIFNF